MHHFWWLEFTLLIPSSLKPPLSAPCPIFCLRENILKTAKALVEDTKMLVSGAASGQDKLAQAAQSSAKTITQLTDVVKLGAASIGSDDPETQVNPSCFLPSVFCLSFILCPCYQTKPCKNELWMAITFQTFVSFLHCVTINWSISACPFSRWFW